MAYLNRGLVRIDCGDLGDAEVLAKELGDKNLLAQIADELKKTGCKYQL